MQARKADMVIRNVDPYDHISSNRIQNNTMQMATGAGALFMLLMVKLANFIRAAGRGEVNPQNVPNIYYVQFLSNRIGSS